MKKMDDGGDVQCSACKASMRKGMKFCADCGEPMNKEKSMNLTDKITDPEVKKAVEKMAADLAAAQALLDEKATTEKGKKTDDDVLKSLSPEARELVEKARAQSEAATKAAELATAAVEKMEGDRIEKSFIEKASALKNLSVDATVLGPILKRVSVNKSTDADQAEILRVLSAANEAVKASKLMKSAGKSDVNGDPAGTAAEVTLSKARELIAKRKVEGSAALSVPDAISEVLRNDPELYLKHRAESRASSVDQDGEDEL